MIGEVIVSNPRAVPDRTTKRPPPQALPRPATPPTPQTPASTSSDELEARRLKSLLSNPEMRVSTHYDEASGYLVMQVQSRATGEVVDQIPTEALLRLSASLRESLVDQTA
jgi:uncharacterized FlaG/YvyC family protein